MLVGWGGAYAASHITVLHMKRLNKSESPIFVTLCVLCFQRQSFRFLFYVTVFTVLVLCRVAAVKSLPVHHHSADDILFPLGSLSPFGYFENRIKL